MKDKALQGFNECDAEKWAKQVNWLGLAVVKAPIPLGNVGFVEFIASFTLNRKPELLHEVSEFHFEHDRWYYVGIRS